MAVATGQPISELLAHPEVLEDMIDVLQEQRDKRG